MVKANWICYKEAVESETKSETLQNSASKIFTGILFAQKLDKYVLDQLLPQQQTSPSDVCFATLGRRPTQVNSKESVISVSENEYLPLLTAIEGALIKVD